MSILMTYKNLLHFSTKKIQSETIKSQCLDFLWMKPLLMSKWNNNRKVHATLSFTRPQELYLGTVEQEQTTLYYDYCIVSKSLVLTSSDVMNGDKKRI